MRACWLRLCFARLNCLAQREQPPGGVHVQLVFSKRTGGRAPVSSGPMAPQLVHTGQ